MNQHFCVYFPLGQLLIRTYKTVLILFILIIVLLSCTGQNNPRQPKSQLDTKPLTHMGITRIPTPTDTSSGWRQPGQKILVTGIVFQRDGKTPAPNVLVYYYQTNTEGRYVHKLTDPRSMSPNDLGQTHGYIRGWVKTDSIGRYSIYTVRPGIYPSQDAPAHIHMTIKEPNEVPEYYIDDITFDDDKLLTTAYRKKMENRSGSGVLRLLKLQTKDSLQVGERNIVLGLHIPDYPGQREGRIISGKEIGEDVFSFTPYHAWGPDKGTKACPICKYGRYHGILYFVGNQPDWVEVKLWLNFLESEGVERERYLKVYFIYGNEASFNHQTRLLELEKLGRDLKLQKTALTFVPSLKDLESDIALNEINPDVSNTFVLYKNVKIIAKYVDLKPSEASFEQVKKALDKSINKYFYID